MKKLEYWLQKNNIMTNAGKTISVMSHKTESNFLGILITENLKWNVHVRSLSLKLRKVSYHI